MRTYKEYPIRCKVCNEQIACFAEEYERLVRKYNTKNDVTKSLAIEKALNELGIMDPCSRIAFMNPITVFLNVEDRDLIEGTKDTDFIGNKRTRKALPATRDIFEKTTTSISTTSIEDRLKITSSNILQERENELAGDLLEQEFKYPTIVGTPTINPILGIENEIVNVGGKHQIRVLNGRTYLAQ